MITEEISLRTKQTNSNKRTSYETQPTLMLVFISHVFLGKGHYL